MIKPKHNWPLDRYHESRGFVSNRISAVTADYVATCYGMHVIKLRYPGSRFVQIIGPNEMWI